MVLSSRGFCLSLCCFLGIDGQRYGIFIVHFLNVTQIGLVILSGENPWSDVGA